MKAVVLHEYGGPDKLKYEDVPDPVAGEGQVLVRVAATSVNPIDYKMRSGAVKDVFPLELPAILGTGHLGNCARAGCRGQRIQARRQGDGDGRTEPMRSLTVVAAKDLAFVPEKLDLVKAAALPLVTLTGEQLITRGTKIQSGQTVLVTGAVGSVGRSAVWTAKKAGAKVIAGVKKVAAERGGDARRGPGVGAGRCGGDGEAWVHRRRGRYRGGRDRRKAAGKGEAGRRLCLGPGSARRTPRCILQ